MPHKLQDKIAEFNAQLDNARENDREELEKELAELRSSDTDRLQAVADKVHKTIGELTRLEAASTQDFNARTEHVHKAQAAFAKSQDEAVAALRQAYAALTRDLAAAQSSALAEIDRRIAERTAAAVSAINSAAEKLVASPDVFGASPATSSSKPAGESPAPSTFITEAASDVASPPRRPRKSRREETLADVAPAVQQSSTTLPTNGEVTGSPSTPPPFAEPPPVPIEKIAEIAPVAPSSAEPFPIAVHPTKSSHVDSAPKPAALADASANAKSPAPEFASTTDRAEPAAPKRSNRKSTAAEPESELSLQLTSEDSAASDDTPFTSAELMEHVISSDGATRLIATSYIGIGNRLFIRGEGPGLSWEKGVPLQFVSIGKWRWETPDATAPVRFKLYKNDDVECPGLGTLELGPGHQQEVIAKF